MTNPVLAALARHATDTPNAPAVLSGSLVIPYRALAETVARAAGVLAHAFKWLMKRKSWMAGTSPAMTILAYVPPQEDVVLHLAGPPEFLHSLLRLP